MVSRPVQWKYGGDQIGATMTALHKRLARLRQDHPALRSALMHPAEWADWQTEPDPVGVGFDMERQLAVYHRWAVLEDGTAENVVVVLNFSDTSQVLATPSQPEACGRTCSQASTGRQTAGRSRWTPTARMWLSAATGGGSCGG